jgi:2'-5' RNA ligase
VRTFIALNLPLAERQSLHDATRPLRDAAAGASWVAPENLHLTLKFLGSVDQARVTALADRLRAVARTHRPLALDIGGAGVFPNLRAPRIVWMGVGADGRLELLHHDVEQACEEAGFPVEGRAFRPHITLGRVKSPLDATTRRALGEAMRTCVVARRVTVSTVDVMSSTPGPGGSAYRVETAAPLGAGEER